MAAQSEIERHRTLICAWLEANGVDPRLVPSDSYFSIAGDQLTYDRIVFEAPGRPAIEGDDVVRDRVTTTITASLDSIVKSAIIRTIKTQAHSY
jgi:hypothetical protein